MRLEPLREAVAEGGRRLLASGLVRLTEGNLSARDPASGLVAISPSGIPYGRVHAAQVALVDLAGRVVEGQARPSSELAMHLEVYRRRGDVGAVVHTHSVAATSLAVLGREVPAVHYAIAPLGDVIRVAPYALFGTERLARLAAGTLGDSNAVLLANHGVLVAGADLEQALEHAATVEYLAELYSRAVHLGVPVVLPPEALAEVRSQVEALGYGRPPDR